MQGTNLLFSCALNFPPDDLPNGKSSSHGSSEEVWWFIGVETL
jgi:hypothetical protein